MLNPVRFLLLGGALTGVILAEELPMLSEKPWLGCFAGFESSSFDVAVGSDGETIIYHKNRGKRLSDIVATKVRFILEEEVKGKWVKRKIQEDGFATSQEPNPDADEVRFTATYTGGTKVQIDHEFSRGKVLLGVKVVEKTTENPVRAGVETMVGDLFRNIERDVPKDELEDVLDDKIQKTRLKLEPFEGSARKYDLGDTMKEDEKAEFDELVQKLKSVELSSEKIGNNRIVWMTEDTGKGYLELRQTKPLYHGFYVVWRPLPGKEGEEGSRLEMEMK
ncbi:MAG: hypothetical protein HKN82_11345 [Akkermansiaceae bacterium]|nr:hypothetical protein [Akkermansiaceae bacterium]NNM29915.1 hypothetical protein [Akkermansiaceae bacterium]